MKNKILTAVFSAALFSCFLQGAEAGLTTKFTGTSPSCLSCHSLEKDGLGGHYLAVDISGVYEDFGGEGLSGFLKNIPVKLMADAYAAYPLSDGDIKSVIEDFKKLDEGKYYLAEWLPLKSHAVAGILLFVIFMIILKFVFNGGRKAE